MNIAGPRLIDERLNEQLHDDDLVDRGLDDAHVGTASVAIDWDAHDLDERE